MLSRCRGNLTLGIGLWLLLFNSPISYAQSPADARKAIEAAYQKAAEAARLKFIDGIFSVRAPIFSGYGANGQRVDPAKERALLEQLLIPALSIKETTRIVSFRQDSGASATCKVQDVLEIVTHNPTSRQPILMVLKTDSTDEWALTSKGWRQTTNRVHKQSLDSRQTVAPDLKKATPAK